MNKLQCQVCEKVFKHRQSLSRHTCNTQSKKFSCEGCGKSFLRKDALGRHKNTCKGRKQLLVCKICDKEFPNNSKLLRHIKKHNKSNFKCDFCSKTFSRSDHFNNHQMRPCNDRKVDNIKLSGKKRKHFKEYARRELSMAFNIDVVCNVIVIVIHGLYIQYLH